MKDEEQHDGEFSLVVPFWIDTDGYSDRDRLMFCAGVEFEMTLSPTDTCPITVTTCHPFTWDT